MNINKRLPTASPRMQRGHFQHLRCEPRPEAPDPAAHPSGVLHPRWAAWERSCREERGCGGTCLADGVASLREPRAAPDGGTSNHASSSGSSPFGPSSCRPPPLLCQGLSQVSGSPPPPLRLASSGGVIHWLLSSPAGQLFFFFAPHCSLLTATLLSFTM